MVILFFKQKTAYEMRISDWSSDVCSSDLVVPVQIFVPVAGQSHHRDKGSERANTGKIFLCPFKFPVPGTPIGEVTGDHPELRAFSPDELAYTSGDVGPGFRIGADSKRDLIPGR